MRCLMCGKMLGEGSLKDILFGEDLLCEDCRRQWCYAPQYFTLSGIKAESDYLYNDAFSSCLIQYKECGDEALKDVFLAAVRKKRMRKYRGWTLCLMPSSQEKMAQRGFSHLAMMYECLGLPVMEPFEKAEQEAQKTQNYAGRQKMQGGIRLKTGIELPQKIVLCDDVITTGATLKGALKCLDLTEHQVQIYTAAADCQEGSRKRGAEWR